MSRCFTYKALTLRVKPSGESNREAWFLTTEEGVIRATVFGGPKSRLRSYVAPFHSGKLWIYHDPVRGSRKVSDFDVESWRPGIRELWERAMTADAAAETVLSTMGGGGNWETAQKLAEKTLDALNDADPPACTCLGVYFLWHWAGILGVKPDFPVCSVCSGEAKVYSFRDEALFCEKCNPKGLNSAFSLSSEALNWLKSIETLAPTAILPINSPALEQAKALSQAILASALGKRLPTWNEM